jgi:hypothetical protein
MRMRLSMARSLTPLPMPQVPVRRPMMVRAMTCRYHAMYS